MGEFHQVIERATQLKPEVVDRMWQHWELVKRWNPKINLTAIQHDRDAASTHYLDSLAASGRLTGSTMDAGSGAGYPGIPLAIAHPEFEFLLLEPRRKRVSFLRTVVGQLSLANVRVLMGRSTDSPSEKFQHVVTRATFSSNQDLVDCLEWLEPGGSLIAYRSHDAEPPTTGPIPEVVPYQIPTGFRALHIWGT